MKPTALLTLGSKVHFLPIGAGFDVMELEHVVVFVVCGWVEA